MRIQASFVVPLMLAALALGQEQREYELPSGTFDPPDVPPLRLGEWVDADPEAWPKAPQGLLLVGHREEGEVAWRTVPQVAELAARFRHQGLRSAAVVVGGGRPEGVPEALEVLAHGGIASLLQDGGGVREPRVLVLDPRGQAVWMGPPSAGLSFVLERFLEGEPVPPPRLEFRLERMGEIEDIAGDDMLRWAEALVEENPRDPEGWIYRVLHALERAGDPQAARRWTAEACRAMAMEPAPLARFTEHVLAMRPCPQELVQQALMALAPAAAAVREDLHLQCLYLRVVLTVGRNAEGERLIGRLEEALGDHPEIGGMLAEAVVHARDPEPFGEVALGAIERARESWGGDAALQGVHYALLVRLGREEEAEALFTRLRGGRGSLNNVVWYMLTRLPSGRGHTEALAARYAEEMLRTGETASHQLDTIALAFHRAGRHERAVEIQERAVGGAASGAYQRRLELFRTYAER